MDRTNNVTKERIGTVKGFRNKQKMQKALAASMIIEGNIYE